MRGDLWADGVILLAGGLQEDIDAAKTGQASAALSDVRAMIERIATIYAIEERVRGTSADIRLAARQRESKQLMEELKTRLIEVLRNISAKSPLAEAINYTLGHWEGLTIFLTDGRVEVDTNTVERSISQLR